MKKTLLIVAFMVYAWQLMAGWEITQKVSDPDGMVNYDVMLIQDNVMKYNGTDVSFIININKNELTFIMEQSKNYWQGNPREFRESMHSAMKKMMDRMMEQVPDAQREMYKQMLGDMDEMYSTPTDDEINSVNITIEDTGETTDIAGYSSEKYLVKIDGKIVETAWISKGLDLSRDFDPRKMQEMMVQIQPNVEDDALFEYTDEYLDLMDKGFLMKSIDPENETTEVIKVVERNIPATELKLPDGYTKVTIDQLMQQQMMSGGEDDDNGGW